MSKTNWASSTAWSEPARMRSEAARWPAGEHAHRGQNDGLARPGLAGEHGQPRPRFQLQGLDEREIAYAQVGKHRA